MADTWDQLLDEARRVVDDVRYNARQPNGTVSVADWSKLGSVSDYLGQIRALPLVLDPPVPVPPPVPPTPATLQGFGGSYSGHNPAVDVYLGEDATEAEWGKHWGHPVLAPAAGTVSVYTFPTPLSSHLGLGSDADEHAHARYLQNHVALFRGINEPGACYYGAQTMFFALLTFDTPQRLSNGQMCKAVWIGHCRGDVAVGRVEKGQPWCVSHDSGIRFESAGIQARASHCHTCGTATGNLSMNGDVSGFLVAELLGWKVRDVGVLAGPNDYLGGQWVAGKPRSAWTGRTIPPMPS